MRPTLKRLLPLALLLALFLSASVFPLAAVGRAIYLALSNGDVGYDFLAFAGAARIAAEQPGALSQVYDYEAFMAQLSAFSGSEIVGLPWFYPPPFFFFVAPLASLPLVGAFVLWMAGSFLAGWLLGQAYGLGRWAFALMIAPPLLSSIVIAHNGALSALLLGLGLAWSDKRPLLSGILFGLLVYKPQFALLLPFVLVADGRWRTILAAAVTGASLCLLSLLVHGEGAWRAFLAARDLPWELLFDGRIEWARTVTTYAFARLIGLGNTAALFLQVASAVIALCVCFLAWRWRVSLAIRASLVAVGALLVSPYGFFYELALLAIPLAALSGQLLREGNRGGGRVALVLYLWCLPTVLLPLWEPFRIQVWPPALLFALFWLFALARREKVAAGSPAPEPLTGQ